MTRASISSLVETETGLSLLWIHMCLLFWITLTWIATLVWICNGAFRLRALSIAKAAATAQELAENLESVDPKVYPHPHPQYAFQEVPSLDSKHPNRGLRLRTVMVSNVPHSLRDEKELKEYFEYWLSRKIEKPSIGVTSSVQPGLINKTVTFVFNRAKKLPGKIQDALPTSAKDEDRTSDERDKEKVGTQEKPVVEKVVIARKMTELASLLERREEILRLLETAHIKLANKALEDVKEAMVRKKCSKPLVHHRSTKAAEQARKRISRTVPDPEEGPSEPMPEEERMEKLVEVLGPFVREFGMLDEGKKKQSFSAHRFKGIRRESDDSSSSDTNTLDSSYPPFSDKRKADARNCRDTVWDALLSLPRSTLEAYQPLIKLGYLFRGRVVPTIDYYTAKYNLLTDMITQNRAKAIADYDPTSTAFVTFADTADARRACKYLAVHPKNPLTCLVTMAPEYQDIDWIRVMKSSFRVEFVKDWIVNVGVW
jgi:hypothetical protein